MRRLTSSILASALLLTMMPSSAAAVTSSGVVDEFENTRDTIRNIYEDDIPTTADEIDEFADDIEDALDNAMSELEDLYASTYLTDDMTIRYWADLVRLETLFALDELRIYSATYDQDSYEDSVDQIWDALNDFMDLVDERTMALDHTLCFIEAISSPKSQFIGTQDLLSEISDELYEISQNAEDATYESEVNRIEMRMNYSGYYAYSYLASLFRISNSNLNVLKNDIEDMQDMISDIRNNVADAVGSSSNLDDELERRADLLVAQLDDTVDELERDISLSNIFDSTWDANRNAHLDLIMDILDEAVYTINDRTDEKAIFATSARDHVELRELNYTEYLIAIQLVKAYKIPLFMNEAEDLEDGLNDIEDALENFLDELDDSLGGGNDDLMNETEDIFDELNIDPEDYIIAIEDRKTFSDMPNQADFRNAFDALISYKIVNGNNNRLLPNWKVTRFEFVKMVLDSTCNNPGAYFDRKLSKKRLSAYPSDLRNEMVDAYMAKAVDMGLLSGDNGRLNPDKPVTRYEAMIIVNRVYNPVVIHTDGGSYWYLDAPENSTDILLPLVMSQFQIIQQPSSSVRYLRPNDGLSRGEAAKMIWLSFMEWGYTKGSNVYIPGQEPHPGGHIHHNNLYGGY